MAPPGDEARARAQRIVKEALLFTRPHQRHIDPTQRLVVPCLVSEPLVLRQLRCALEAPHRTFRAHTERELDAEACARGAHRAEKRRRWEVVLRRQHAHRAHRPARVGVHYAKLVGVMVRYEGSAPARPREQALLRLTAHHEHILPTASASTSAEPVLARPFEGGAPHHCRLVA